jgi:hypothetical protein
VKWAGDPASIGLVTTVADVYRFWEFARSFRNAAPETLDYIGT